MELKEKICSTFESRFGGHGTFYASAGRINLIGEHTDYNGGFVFPGAIDKVIMAEIRPNNTETVRVYSIDIDDYAEFGLNEADAPQQSWARYIFGVCREIIKRGGKVEGFDAVFAGNVPLGAGLSSSAALESCFAFALNDMFNGNAIDKFELARIGQSTEHNYCGVNCGIMDQFASVFGKKDHLMRLDCRSMEFEYFPFKADGYTLVLVDSVVKHELADSPYNKRRASCERVAKRLGIETLRDADMDMLDSVKSDITAEDYFRAKFVIEEKDRVLAVCDALVKNDFERLRGIVRRARLSQRNRKRMRRDRFAHHGWRLRRLHHQPGKKRAAARLHRQGQGTIQRQIRPRTQGLRSHHQRRRPQNRRLNYPGQFSHHKCGN